MFYLSSRVPHFQSEAISAIFLPQRPGLSGHSTPFNKIFVQIFRLNFVMRLYDDTAIVLVWMMLNKARSKNAEFNSIKADFCHRPSSSCLALCAQVYAEMSTKCLLTRSSSSSSTELAGSQHCMRTSASVKTVNICTVLTTHTLHNYSSHSCFYTHQYWCVHASWGTWVLLQTSLC